MSGESGVAVSGSWPVRVGRSHPLTLSSIGVGVVAFLLMPRGLELSTRAVLAWDIGVLLMLVLAGQLFVRKGEDHRMAENAAAQQEGEWSIFWLTLAGVVFSFVALTQELADVKTMSPRFRDLHVGLVAATLLLSWLVTHVLFAMRYAHEFYEKTDGVRIDGGLEFPGDEMPDYWDFVYFSLVLGMTFQVSDVQITSKKLRRLATAHGLIGFLFNTIIVALTVNIAAGLLS